MIVEKFKNKIVFNFLRSKMITLYCSSESDKAQGHKYLEILSDAFGSVSKCFSEIPNKIELIILSQEEWMTKPFGKSQPYGSPICPDYRIFIGQSIDQSLVNATTLLQRRLSLKLDAITEQDFGFLLVHEMGHVLLRNELTENFFHSRLFDQIQKSKFSFLGEFHAQLVLMEYLRSLNKKTIWSSLSTLCFANKKNLEIEFGKLENFGENYKELISKNSGEGIYYFQLLFLGIAKVMYTLKEFTNNPLKLFNEEISKMRTFDDLKNSHFFNKILDLSN